MITSGLVLCFGCSANLEIGTYTSENSLSTSELRYRLSQCLFLLCGKCISGKIEDTYSCLHFPTCPTFDISIGRNKPVQRSKRDDIKMNLAEIPTKLRALLKSLNYSQWGEKRYVQGCFRLQSGGEETILTQKCSVVFSYWTTNLDLIESMLKVEAITFTRIDCEMSRKQRTEAIEKFPKDGNIQVILVSITSGGIGYS
jgi:SNF2 family DNA or RNA helicase